jgi:hypothetical protein
MRFASGGRLSGNKSNTPLYPPKESFGPSPQRGRRQEGTHPPTPFKRGKCIICVQIGVIGVLIFPVVGLLTNNNSNPTFTMSAIATSFHSSQRQHVLPLAACPPSELERGDTAARPPQAGSREGFINRSPALAG